MVYSVHSAQALINKGTELPTTVASSCRWDNSRGVVNHYKYTGQDVDMRSQQKAALQLRGKAMLLRRKLQWPQCFP